MGLRRHLPPCFLIFCCVFLGYVVDGHPHSQGKAQPSYFSRTWIANFGPFLESKRDENLTLEDDEDCEAPTHNTFSVDDFGARGDGTDSTEAFSKAWEAACSTEGAALLVPQGKSYLVNPITLKGPCKSPLKLQISGTIEAPEDVSVYKEDQRHWLVIEDVENLLVEGGGTIKGNGNVWWQISCKRSEKKSCNDDGAPTALTFKKNKNLVVNNLNILDAQQMHLTFDGCVNVEASNLVVTAPEESPNTDGIHVTNTQNIRITRSTIGTGDDCISIVSGSQRVMAQDITCGPGHGISIGSLGKDGSEDYVSDVVVDGAKIYGTTNGVRIKTWQGGSGFARDVKFLNIEMNNVTNPIIIDQNYCDQDKACKEQNSAVQVQNVLYQKIGGSSASDVAIKLDCSKSHPCLGVVLQDVKLGGDGGGVTAQCDNVNMDQLGDVSPSCPCSADDYR